MQDKARDWWLPGDQQAVYRFPKTDDLSQLARIKPQAVSISGKEVFRIYEDSRGDVWISTTQGGAPLKRFEITGLAPAWLDSSGFDFRIWYGV